MGQGSLIMSIQKEVHSPRFANDHDSRIAYTAIYVENGESIKSCLVEVNDDDPQFQEIIDQFGKDELYKNKQEFLQEQKIQQQKEANRQQNAKDTELFNYKTGLFDYNFVYNASNRKLRRQIRKADNIEDARLAATALFIAEAFGIETIADVTHLLSPVSDDNE